MSSIKHAIRYGAIALVALPITWDTAVADPIADFYKNRLVTLETVYVQ